MLNVEGYTDNVGSDDYNQKLSNVGPMRFAIT